MVQKVKQVNRSRKTGEPELSYIAAPPRMALYVEYSTRIYDIYLKYVAPEDIHVYSIDEVFMDVTHYLKTYGMTAYQLAQTIILDVQDHIGDHGHCRDRNQPVFVQNRNGYCGKAHRCG